MTDTDGQGRPIAQFVWEQRKRINFETCKLLHKENVLDGSDFFILACANNYIQDKSNGSDIVTFCSEFHINNLDVNKCGHGMQTFPLHAACLGMHHHIVQKLIEHGVNLLQTNIEGKTSLWICCYLGNAEIANTLISTLKQRQNVIKDTLKKYINQSDVTKTTPLWLCAWLGHNDIMKVLLENHADVDTPDGKGMRPIWAACHGGNLRGLVQLFIHNARIIETNSTPKYGHSVLHFAAADKDTAALHILLDLVGDVNLQDPEGNTPLHAAVDARNGDSIKLLLSKGASCYIRNKQGLTPMDVARVRQYLGAATILEQSMRQVKKY